MLGGSARHRLAHPSRDAVTLRMPKKKADSLLPAIFKTALNALLAVVGLWLAGLLFFFFSVASSQPRDASLPVDVIVVLTGGTNRIEEGLQLLAKDQAKAMLVTGVHPDVTREILLKRWQGDEPSKIKLLKHCCLFVEHAAATTEQNAAETKAWLDRNGGADGVSVRLVTSDYHMPRAKILFRREMPGADIYPWPVKTRDMTTRNFARTLVTEYIKTILTWVS